MKLHLKFWIYAILAVLSIAGFLLMIYTYQVGQYGSAVKLTILGAMAFASLLLSIWIGQSNDTENPNISISPSNMDFGFIIHLKVRNSDPT
jgi:hypothetical protein